MAKNHVMECWLCDQHVLEIRTGVPRTHYVRGTNNECPASNRAKPVPVEEKVRARHHDR